MAKGAHYYFPSARTVADVGAEEGRAAKLDEKGMALDFAINEKCAAGAGCFIESWPGHCNPVGADGAARPHWEQGNSDERPVRYFRRSEVVGLIHAKTEKKDISKAIHDSMASRIVSMIRRIGVNEDVVLVGGVGYNPGFVETMRRELRLEKIQIPEKPEFAASVGAADWPPRALYWRFVLRNSEKPMGNCRTAMEISWKKKTGILALD